MRLKLKILGRDLKIFAKLWWDFLFWRGYAWFSRFERVKRWTAQTLYRQRGRFARPFVHTGMAGLLAMAVTLAPVLASSFPGVGESQEPEVSPSAVVMELTEDATGTTISDKVRDKVVEYSVKSGDTVSSIAAKFGIDSDTIRWENNLSSASSIKPGQTLRILPVSGVRHKVARGETVYSIAKKYDAGAQAIVDFPFNTFVDNETFALAVGQELIVPEG